MFTPNPPHSILEAISISDLPDQAGQAIARKPASQSLWHNAVLSVGLISALLGVLLFSDQAVAQESATVSDHAPASDTVPRFHNLQYWQQLYGPQIRFEITRDGKAVGDYQLDFIPVNDSPGLWTVKTDMQMKFDLLVFFSYRFRYQAIEQWQNQQLLSFESRIDRNGKKQKNQLIRQNELAKTAKSQSDGPNSETAQNLLYQVSGLAGDFQLPGPIALSNHYNANIIRESRLFNSLSGKENQIQLIAQGKEKVFDGQNMVSSQRYQYSGDLEDTWVWYDAKGRWLRLRFIAEDGSEIQFNCLRCSPDQHAISSASSIPNSYDNDSASDKKRIEVHSARNTESDLSIRVESHSIQRNETKYGSEVIYG